MSHRSAAAALAAFVLVLLAGCAAPAGTVGSSSPISTVTPTIGGVTAQPTGSTPTPKPTTGTTSKPPVGVPTVAGALDVGAELSSFASPSGRIWCATDAQSAWCHFPKGMKGTVPPKDEVCPGEGLDVTGVMIAGEKAAYFCSGEPTAFPVKGTDQVAWHDGTGFPFVNYTGFTLAVLPYGKKIMGGVFICDSESSGVTCANSATSRGFRISMAGPEFF